VIGGATDEGTCLFANATKATSQVTYRQGRRIAERGVVRALTDPHSPHLYELAVIVV
jgi:hypothetical protein